ncbi:UNVERIFIED_CONTAM: NADPH:quinone oxidoreductase [Sesamum latifolium]|uniref:NAD(P)H dehydrogenase (quinone) n=1 Tax=Sesamum latifolium TaxID=2727402 RepID=A0AAW2XP01_9LAMI
MEVSKSINGLEIEYVDISPLPFLNTDLEVDGTYPPVVEAFRQKILAADSVLFASPEYNYSITAMEVSKSINGLQIEYVDISPLPFVNTDLEVDGTYPPVVEAFRQKILAADSVLFASPEYNYSVTGTQ